MNKLLLLVIVLFFQQGLYAEYPVHLHSLSASMQVVYTCPMHPEVKSGKPGNCPKCGMKLVLQKTKAVKPPAPAPVKTAPMPKAASPVKIAPAPQSAVVYTCPMHPEVKSNKPENCPKCGMKLVVQKSAAPKRATPSPVKKTPPAKKGNMDGMTMPAKKESTPVKAEPVSEPAENHQEHEMPMTETDTVEAAEEIDAIQIAKANLGPVKTISNKTPPRTVRYDLYIADTMVNFTGKPKRAIAVNGQIPMPTLTFTEGDTAEIYVHNRLKEETSLHWHGLFLPNKMDGVPYLTQMPIKPGATYVYKFPIIQHGTHWYHSHSGLQEQLGMYGSFIMNKREEWDIPTIPVIISEWLDMKPDEAHRSLHAATDWFAVRKGAEQTYLEAIKLGWFKTKVKNEWKRMNAMDLTDIYYDSLLINGRNQIHQPQFKAGDKVRLRIANGGASDYFWLSYSGGKITVVATDGNDVEPIEVDRLIIAVSETYDVVVTIPENKSYEFLATPEDRTKFTSLWLGSGEKVPAVRWNRPKYFLGMRMMNDMMDMNGNLIEMEGMEMKNQVMDMNTVMYPEITGEEIRSAKKVEGMEKRRAGKKQTTPMAGMDETNSDMVSLSYEMLRAPEKTTLPVGPWREIKFDLTGNMNRYVWSIDNKVVSESDKILIRKGENVRIILFNNSMMRHPMHLHGHDFRLLGGQGENAIMKNVIDIMPMERDTIEFNANERGGDWFFHCHILYHMMSGMGKVFSYDNPLVDKTDITNPKVAKRGLNSEDRKFHAMGSVGLESNGSDGEFMLASTRFKLSTEWRLGLDAMHGNESETNFGRYLGRNQWIFPFIGFDYHRNTMRNEGEKNMFGQISNQTNRKAFVAGIQYTLPMLFIAEQRIDSKGKLRFQLSREDIPVAPRLRLNISGNTDKEYTTGLRYIVTKYFNLSTHYDSDMGFGGGLTLTY
ncbi:copper-resistance protein, CopA family [Daejeonella rubra]|uniref:Copper-resistance protein, CopA family n=1 Tax=Daejeonella rubra TaxID=990371 RepID=A0A1G9NLD2_9SPHI|nr:multicopper oxidase domain-containing protein [Daejeonella rubra]SDL87416.1 copper-resistance protein, CopA family [Daejeonella rubra]